MPLRAHPAAYAPGVPTTVDGRDTAVGTGHGTAIDTTVDIAVAARNPR